MTLNYPGPYEIRLFYTTTVSSVAQEHIQHLSLELTSEPDPGDAFSTIECTFRTGSPTHTFLDDIIDDWVLDMKTILSSGGGNTIDRAELWHYESGSFDASFISAYTIAVNGTSGSAIVPAGQDITTMRTTLGGIFKLSFMETVNAAGVTDTGTIASAGIESMVADIENAQYPWRGRDGGFPFVRIARYPGINEANWKRRFRP